MNKKHAIALAATAAAVLVATGCAHRSSAEADQQAVSLIKSSFQPQGIAKLDRLDQDAANAACSKALGEPLPEAQAKAIEAANMKTVPAAPAAGYLGDWKQGEKIAQSGRGMTWRDKPGNEIARLELCAAVDAFRAPATITFTDKIPDVPSRLDEPGPALLAEALKIAKDP